MANRRKVRVRDFDRFEEAHRVPRVSRDPCQRCGARGDVDCGHRKVQLVTIMNMSGSTLS
jgi:hypothetical protein